MSRLSTKKQIIIFVIGSIINLLFFCLTKYLNFPLWLDYSGSFYIATVCNPIWSAISLILHTILLWVLIDGATALLPMISAIFCSAIIFYFFKNVEKNIFRFFSTAECMVISSVIINTLIFLCLKLPIGRYSSYADIFSQFCVTNSKLFSSFFFACAISFAEVTLSFIVALVCYLLTPRRDENIIFKK